MDQSEDQTLLAALRTLVRAARARDDVRESLRTLALWAARELEQAEARPGEPAPQPAPEPARAPAPIVTTTLRMGDARVTVPVHGTAEEARAADAAAADTRAERPPPRDRGPAPELTLVVARARLKAEASRWAVERRSRIERGADHMTSIKPTDAALVERARHLRECYLWMLDPYAPLPSDDALLRIAGSYEALADAADAAHRITAAGGLSPAGMKELYYILAEAQSMLRAALVAADIRPDRDQADTFMWLRGRTFADRVFIDRHMKLEDPADPAQWEDLRARVKRLADLWAASRDHDRELNALRHKAQYHARRIALNGEVGAPHDWTQLLTSVDAMASHGVPANSREVTDLLAPLLDRLPDELPTDAGRAALDAADRAQAAREADERDAVAAREPSPDVARAADLLRGKIVVLIGGQRRPQAAAALERALGLRELRWVASQPHESLSTFEPDIARPDTALVLLAIRWSSHSFGELQDVCTRHGKPFVRLPGGYSPNQVAAQVVAQASSRLQAAS